MTEPLSEGLGREAFERIQAHVEDATPTTTRFRLDVAASQAISVAEKIAHDDVREALDRLPEWLWDAGARARLKDLAWAALYAKSQDERARDQASAQRTVPADTYERAVELRQRMFKVLDYHLGHIAAVRAELDAIRSGRGYRDTADDLSRMAGLYQEHTAALNRDPIHYRPDDAHNAIQLAEAIITALSVPEPPTWARTARVIASCLREDYDELRWALSALYRKDDPFELAQLPSLYQASRASSRAPSPTLDPSPSAPDAPTDVS